MEILIRFFSEVWSFYQEIAIYLLFGFVVAGILHVLFPESIVRKQLGKSSLSSVIKSTLFGIPLPLCSCGVVPVAASMRKSGASKGSVISFLITTPQIGADSFFLTYSLIGWVFAVGRIVASVITALIAGIAINLLDPDRTNEAEQGTGESTKDNSLAERLRSVPSYIEYELLGSIINTLLIGILIAGAVGVFVPDNFFSQYLGGPFVSMLVMLAIGIPIYVCASASTPIAAALMMKGLSPGAALVFLLSGPATNAVNLSTVVKIVGKKATTFYLLAIAGVSLLLGFLLNQAGDWLHIPVMSADHQHDVLPHWLRLFGTVTFGLMIIWYYVNTKIINKIKIRRIEVPQMVLSVRGMSCMHCAKNVENAVSAVEGTSDIVVNLDEGKVQFNIDDAGKVERVKKQIELAGYEV